MVDTGQPHAGGVVVTTSSAPEIVQYILSAEDWAIMKSVKRDILIEFGFAMLGAFLRHYVANGTKAPATPLSPEDRDRK